MKIVQEFREFAIKGNMVDLAVGIVIGAAFGKVVTSLVEDILMPPLGYLIGGVDFTGLAIALPAIQEGKEDVTIRYGAFLQNLVDFLIVAAAIFMVIKVINRLRREKPAPEPAPAEPPRQEVLLQEIRDLLKNERR